jgi:hypothetical protein
MIWLMRSVILIAAILPPILRAAAPDPDALISRLARQAPASIAFTEVFFSRLLFEPIIVSGELIYAGPTSLDRRITEPYRENTAIRGESVRVERDGEPPRSFALKRAPDLRGLATAFISLLAGNTASVKRDFSIATSGDDEAWHLTLTPVETRARRRLKQISVSGSGSEPRCVAMLSAQDGASIMLLGAAADTRLPSDVTFEDLLNQCRAE